MSCMSGFSHLVIYHKLGEQVIPVHDFYSAYLTNEDYKEDDSDQQFA